DAVGDIRRAQLLAVIMSLSVITKDFCRYTMIFLRQEKTLRDHRTGNRFSAPLSWPTGLVRVMGRGVGRDGADQDERAGGRVRRSNGPFDRTIWTCCFAGVSPCRGLGLTAARSRRGR